MFNIALECDIFALASSGWVGWSLEYANWSGWSLEYANRSGWSLEYANWVVDH